MNVFFFFFLTFMTPASIAHPLKSGVSKTKKNYILINILLFYQMKRGRMFFVNSKVYYYIYDVMFFFSFRVGVL